MGNDFQCNDGNFAYILHPLPIVTLAPMSLQSMLSNSTQHSSSMLIFAERINECDRTIKSYMWQGKEQRHVKQTQHIFFFHHTSR